MSFFERHPVVAGIVATALVGFLISVVGVISDKYRINFLVALGIVFGGWWVISRL